MSATSCACRHTMGFNAAEPRRVALRHSFTRARFTPKISFVSHAKKSTLEGIGGVEPTADVVDGMTRNEDNDKEQSQQTLEELFDPDAISDPDYSDYMNFEEDPPDHKMGFVAIIGRPNAGKSTLLNALLGQQLSIVTEKAQTTRHRILGIWSEKGHQAVFLDTPGIIATRRNELEERMMNAVDQAVRDADAILAIVDASNKPEKALEMIQPGDNWKGPPMAVILNKIDLLDEADLQNLVEWYETNCKAQVIFPISALETKGVETVASWVVTQLPTGSSMYPKDIISEASERFFVSEIIRRNIFVHYRQELPYEIAVEVTSFKERKATEKILIEANIYVDKKRHVGMLLGAAGSAIKTLSTASRVEIEEFLDRPVYLNLSVKVAEGWRKNADQLQRLGY